MFVCQMNRSIQLINYNYQRKQHLATNCFRVVNWCQWFWVTVQTAFKGAKAPERLQMDCVCACVCVYVYVCVCQND